MTLEVAREVMREVEGGVPSFEPLVRYNACGIMGTDFSVIMRAREYTEKFLVIHEFVKRLDERYRREGIEVPTPRRTASTRTAASRAGTPEADGASRTRGARQRRPNRADPTAPSTAIQYAWR